MPPHVKRCCIVGTAESWRQTPWNDPTLEVWSLNDAYVLGFPRIDRWFEQHPMDKMWFRDPRTKIVDPRQVPKGHYIRPRGHLEWLKQFAATHPVFLQAEPPDDWPANARRFPIEAVTQEFGDSYWACGPSYMLALAVLEGYTEIWITGIHLATEHEYREQRPQFENLLGRLLGRSVKESIKGEFRYYDGDVRIVLPKAAPILQHGWRYAYDPKPEGKPNPYKDELKAVQKEKNALIEALVYWPVGKDKTKQLDRLQRLAIIEMDIRNLLAKKQLGGTLTAKVMAA